MKNHRFLYLVSLLYLNTLNSQSQNLCAGLKDYIRIENANNMPTIEENTENGTLTLTFNQPSVNAIFEDYFIYEFYQAFPSGSESSQEIYAMAYSSRDLINEINEQISPEIIQVDFVYASTSLDPTITDFLNGKQFRYASNCSDIDEIGEFCADNEQIFGEDFNLLVSFSYDPVNDLLKMKTDGLTPCGNAFEIYFRGGVETNKIQVWGTILETVAQNPDCDYAETFFNALLDIGCFEESHYGDTDFFIDAVEDSVTFGRNNTTFSYDYIALEFNALSLYQEQFENVKLQNSIGNSYINISNTSNQDFMIEVYGVSGKRIISKRPFYNNSVNMSSFSDGLYFVRLFNIRNQSQVFKFLKQ